MRLRISGGRLGKLESGSNFYGGDSAPILYGPPRSRSEFFQIVSFSLFSRFSYLAILLILPQAVAGQFLTPAKGQRRPRLAAPRAWLAPGPQIG